MNRKKLLALIYGILAIVFLAAAIIWGLSSKQTFKKTGVDQLSEGGVVLGEANAPVVFVEFGDYQCPACGAFFNQVEDRLISEYVNTGKVKLVWRDIAFLGDESNWAAEATRCANEQGRFWDFHKILFENQLGENRGAFAQDNLKKFAGDLGLNEGDFNQCFDSGKYVNEIEQVTEASFSSGVRSTPTYFINGKKFVGVQPGLYDSIKAEIDRLLN